MHCHILTSCGRGHFRLVLPFIFFIWLWAGWYMLVWESWFYSHLWIFWWLEVSTNIRYLKIFFSNSLIIRDEKRKEITIQWRRFGYVILIIIKLCERMLWISLRIIHVFDKLYPRGRTLIWNRRGCSSEILNLSPKGYHLGCGISKFWPLKETA